MSTMLATRAHDAASALVVEEVPVPEPTSGEVIVKVESAGLAPGMMSLLKMGAFKQLPTILGHEMAGTVRRLGPTCRASPEASASGSILSSSVVAVSTADPTARTCVLSTR